MQASRPAAEVLKSKSWLPMGTRVTHTEIAGAGNMNLVERVYLDDGRSLILKRARAWVEKYPDIPAPIERATVEADFYQTVTGTVAGQNMPEHLGHDPEDATNLLKDLGKGKDGMFMYQQGATLPLSQLDAIAKWTSSLHSIPVSEDMHPRFENKAMRALNALHIFEFPLDPANGFNLDEITHGLQDAADSLKQDDAFVRCVTDIGKLYVASATSDNNVLLHGDLYPGSWLTTDNGLFVIDPEFCWIGPAEWDLGVLLAHLRLSQQPDAYRSRLLESYGHQLDDTLLNQITGIEIMRRIIGVAQLPLEIDLAGKLQLLEEARCLVLDNQ